MKQPKIAIIGGGIAGLTTAIALQNIGLETDVFERAESIKPLGAGIGLGVNAMLAMQVLGLKDELLEQGNLINTFEVLDQHGKAISRNQFQPKNGLGNMSIHRADLHWILLSKLDKSKIHLGKSFSRMEKDANGIHLFFEDQSHFHFNYVIVADGIHSVLRQKLLPASKPLFAGYTCWRGVVDLPQINPQVSSETWGKHGRFGIVPLADQKTYWFACLNTKQNDTTFKSFRVFDLISRFQNYHDPISEILKQTPDKDLLHNDIFDIQPLQQFAFGRTVLIGDAAHATTPNMGQGACQAIEDAVVLADCMAIEKDFEKAFLLFEKKRLERSRWVIETSRRIGRLAQVENTLLLNLRNAMLRVLPDTFAEKNLEKLADVDFAFQVNKEKPVLQ